MGELKMEEMSLPALFDQARKIHTTASESGVDQEILRKGCEALKACEDMINKLGLFSTNETKEDISTTNLKYIMVPFYLAELIEKTAEDDRLQLVKASQTKLKEFISFCEAMELVPEDELDISSQGTPNSLADRRAKKIARFKRQRAAESKLIEIKERKERRGRSTKAATLSTPVEAAEDDVLDDDGEEEREAWLITISLALCKAFDLLEMLKKEEELLSAIKAKQSQVGGEKEISQAVLDERTRTVEAWHRGAAVRAQYTKPAPPITCATFAQDVLEGRAKVSQDHEHTHQPLMLGPASLVGGTLTSERERMAAQVFQPSHRLQMAGKVDILIHHGGKFQQKLGICVPIPFTSYTNGKVNKYTDVNINHLSYFEILGMVRELGYKDVKLYFCQPNISLDMGLRLMCDDTLVPTIIIACQASKIVKFYVEHCIERDSGVSDKGNEINECVNTLDDGHGVDGGVCNEGNGITDGVMDEVRDEVRFEVRDEVIDEVRNEVRDEVVVEEDPKLDDVVMNDNTDELHLVDEDSDDDSVHSLDYVTDDEELTQTRKTLLDLKSTLEDLKNVQADGSDSDEENANNEQIGVSEPNVTEAVHDEPRAEAQVTTTISKVEQIEYDNDNVGDENIDSPPTSEDDETNEKSRTKIKYPVFNPNTPIDKIVFELGMRFSNPKELKDAIRDYAVANGCAIRITRNKPQLVLAVCTTGCSWKLYASWMRDEKSFQIKTLWPDHTCSRKTSLKIVTQTWLASKYGDKIRKNPTWKTKYLVEDVLEKYGLHVSHRQCLRAKKRALGEVENGLIDPINGQNMWPKDNCDPILPPPKRRMLGRPKKNRRKSEHEEEKRSKTSGSLPRTGRQMKCTNCQQLGHNKRTCKNPHVTVTEHKASQASSSAKTYSKTSGKSQTTSRQVKNKKFIRKQTESVPNGFGIYIAPDTGNTFLRNPGYGLPVQLNDTHASQQSQVTQGSTPSRRVAGQPSRTTRNNSSPSMNTRSKTTTAGRSSNKTLGLKRKVAKK